MNAQQRRQLEPLLLNAVKETGRELGRGAYGVVIEVIVSGTVCAAKKLHEAIVQVYSVINETYMIYLIGLYNEEVQ